jgi:hypothetical protein
MQYVEGDEPIHDKWIHEMKVKAIIGKFKDGSCQEQPLKKQMKIFHLEILDEDLHDSCSVNIHNTKNLNQLNDYYQSIIQTHFKRISTQKAATPEDSQQQQISKLINQINQQKKVVDS